MFHTRFCLLTLGQHHQIIDLFSSAEYVALKIIWSAYQNIINAYRAPNTRTGKAMTEAEINTLTSTRVPRGLTELMMLGRTLKRRAGDILASFNHPHTSNGPTEAINGRLEHLRGSALGLAKPHQLHHPSTPRNRRIQTPTTPPIIKSHFTYLQCAQGWVYLCAVRDIHLRRVLGYAMCEQRSTDLVITALDMAATTRGGLAPWGRAPH